jgi:hypothetical protein
MIPFGEAMRSLGAWVKKHWRGVLLFLGGIAAVILGIKVVEKFKVVFGKVRPATPKIPWMRVDGDTNAIAVQVPGTTTVQTIPLPETTPAEKVTAVGYDKDKQIVTVEVTHEVVDRKHPGPAIAGSAFDVLSGGGQAPRPPRGD